MSDKRMGGTIDLRFLGCHAESASDASRAEEILDRICQALNVTKHELLEGPEPTVEQVPANWSDSFTDILHQADGEDQRRLLLSLLRAVSKDDTQLLS